MIKNHHLKSHIQTMIYNHSLYCTSKHYLFYNSLLDTFWVEDRERINLVPTGYICWSTTSCLHFVDLVYMLSSCIGVYIGMCAQTNHHARNNQLQRQQNKTLMSAFHTTFGLGNFDKQMRFIYFFLPSVLFSTTHWPLIIYSMHGFTDVASMTRIQPL